MNDQELKHYGVKGMKWGVRRSMGQRARTAAVYNYTIKGLDKSIGKLERRKSNGGLTNRQKDSLKVQKQNRKEAIDIRNKLIKDLSEKDIKRGERALIARGLLLGPIATGVMAVADGVRAERSLQREKNR